MALPRTLPIWKMASSMYLYWGSGSVPCWRAALALEEKDLGGYPNKLITFSKKEHKTEEMLKLNPRGQVPVFKHGDIVINESLAICDYLESTFPAQGTKLIPDDPAKKASVLQRQHEIQNLNKKGIEDIVHYVFRTKAEDRDEELIKTRSQALHEELDIWQGYLAQGGSNSYIVGPDFSMADVLFFPLVAFLWRLGLKLEKWPQIQSYFENVKQRATVQASWPPHWKESPNQTHLQDV